MDGRRIKSWLLAGTVLVAAGCRTTNPQPPENPAMPQANASKGGFLGIGGGSTFNPKPPAPELVVAKARGSKAKGMKPETELVLAETGVEGALLEGRSANERDALLDAARMRYQKVLAADPQNRVAMVGLAKVYTHSGDKARAIQLCDAAIKLNPKDHELAFQKARILARFEDWNGAADACSAALALDPENLKYPKAVAHYKARAGRWDEAFTILLKRMPEADARFFLGRMLLDQDRIEEGREQMALAMKADPKHADAQAILAMIDTPPTAATVEPVRQAEFSNRR